MRAPLGARMMGAAVLVLAVLGAWQLWTLTAKRPPSRPPTPDHSHTDEGPPPRPATAEREAEGDSDTAAPGAERDAEPVAPFTLDAAERDELADAELAAAEPSDATT